MTTLLDLPNEVLIKIISNLDSRLIKTVITLVNKRFYALFSNDQYWRIRNISNLPLHYPPTQHYDYQEIFWPLVCIRREETRKKWKEDLSDYSGRRQARVKPLVHHTACIDCCSFIGTKDMFILGSRDRTISVWKVEDEENLVLKYNIHDAHKGWIWNFDYTETQFMSCSWDCMVKIWDISTSEMLQSFKIKTAVLCLSVVDNGNVLAVGSYDKKITLYDVRAKEVIKTYIGHTGSVLSLCTFQDRYLISADDHGKLILYDFHGGKILCRNELPEKKCATSISSKVPEYCNWYYVGDNEGNLYLYCMNGVSNALVNVYPHLHEQGITSVHHDIGCITTCSRDGLVKVLDSSSNLNLLYQHRLESALTCVDNDRWKILASGTDGVATLIF